jgi:hypothetical protein
MVLDEGVVLTLYWLSSNHVLAMYNLSVSMDKSFHVETNYYLDFRLTGRALV